MNGMLLNKIILEEYDSSRASAFITERNRLSSVVRNVKYQIIHINEGSVKFTLSEPAVDICMGIVDELDMDFVRLQMLSGGYLMVQKASSYDMLVFYRVEGGRVMSRIYVCKMDGEHMKLFEAFKKYLLDSYQHVNVFNTFMRENYQKNRNNPAAFRKKRLEFINKAVRRIN